MKVARSGAECQEVNSMHDDCLFSSNYAVSGGGEGSSPPSFLVLNKDNVNDELQKTRELATMWDFLV